METAHIHQPASLMEKEMSEYEIERGKPMPSKLHSLIQMNIGFAIKARYKFQYRVLSELSIRLDGDKFVPDISIYSLDASDWHEEEIEMTEPPLLAIEIESPSQSTDDMKAKADKYLAAGVRSVWLVLPALAGVMVLHDGEKAQFYSDGEIMDDALGIRIPVEEVFE